MPTSAPTPRPTRKYVTLDPTLSAMAPSGKDRSIRDSDGAIRTGPSAVTIGAAEPLGSLVFAPRFRLQVREDSLRRLGGNHPGKPLYPRPLHIGHATELPQKLLDCARPHARNVAQCALGLPLPAALAMEAHRETVGLVPNLLDQVQHRRVPVKNARLILLPEDVEDLFFLCNRTHRLVNDLQ